jgi:hypothetical protein
VLTPALPPTVLPLRPAYVPAFERMPEYAPEPEYLREMPIELIAKILSKFTPQELVTAFGVSDRIDADIERILLRINMECRSTPHLINLFLLAPFASVKEKVARFLVGERISECCEFPEALILHHMSDDEIRRAIKEVAAHDNKFLFTLWKIRDWRAGLDEQVTSHLRTLFQDVSLYGFFHYSGTRRLESDLHHVLAFFLWIDDYVTDEQFRGIGERDREYGTIVVPQFMVFINHYRGILPPVLLNRIYNRVVAATRNV